MKSSYGVSFSVLYCDELGIDWEACFKALATDLGVRRVRLMSYWNRIEPERGAYAWDELDRQMELCAKYDIDITLCIGVRQPRYPECHPPSWAKELSKEAFAHAVLNFNAHVVKRYRSEKHIISWQLENEALNRGIGTCTNYDRKRLKHEFVELKELDDRPIIMSTSNSFGLPLLGPIPDIIGFSIYRSQYDYERDEYTYSKTPAWWHRLRATTIRTLLRKPVLCHELQCEPWGPRATVDLSDAEQAHSMNSDRFRDAIVYTQATGLEYTDLWGAEWWYWRKAVRQDDAMWRAAKTLFKGGLQ